MGTQLPHGKRNSSPLPLSNFTGTGFACVHIIRGPCLLWPNGWIDQDAIWYGGRPWPSPHCVRWGPSPPKKQASVSQLHQTHDSDHLLHAMHSPPCPNLYVVCSHHSHSAGWTTANAALGLGRLAL